MLCEKCWCLHFCPEVGFISSLLREKKNQIWKQKVNFQTDGQSSLFPLYYPHYQDTEYYPTGSSTRFVGGSLVVRRIGTIQTALYKNILKLSSECMRLDDRLIGETAKNLSIFSEDICYETADEAKATCFDSNLVSSSDGYLAFRLFYLLNNWKIPF